MTDVLFSFGDEYIYSNNLANWSTINSGQEIEIMENPEKFSIVRTDVINYYKNFSIESDSVIKSNANTRDLLLDGDTIDCYFKTYYIALVNDIIDAGSGYKVNEYIELNKNCYHDTRLDKLEKAIFKIKSVNPDGGITDIELIKVGKFTQEFNEAELDGGSGKGVKLNIILGKNTEKTLKFFSVLNVKREQSYIQADLNEKIKDKFSEGEICIKRYRITLNKSTNKEYSSHPFIVKVEKTPFLNLPLAKDNNIEQIYNQAILTIDSKIKELSVGVK